jgi:hypothetical protein
MAGRTVERMESAAAAISLALTVLVFTPLHVYAANVLEFGFSLGSLLWVCLPAGLLAAFVLTGLTVFLPRAAHEKGVSIVVTLAVLCWVQGNIILWRYGIFDGRPIAWERFRARGIVDILVWSSLLILAWFASPFIRRNTRRIAAVLVLVQGLSVALDISRMPPVEGLHSYAFEGSRKCVFSPDRNVLLIMSDAFQGDLFQEIVALEPEWKSAFPGFTHFPNAVGGYSNTLYSVPLFLTGQAYDKTPVTDYARRAYERSVTRLLLKNGFETEIYPLLYDLIFTSPGLASNMVPKKGIDRSEMASLFDVALFRSAPHPAKKWIFHDQMWLLKGLFPDTRSKPTPGERRVRAKERFKARQYDYYRYDADLAGAMEAQANTGSRRPTFKYFHLKGLHPPLCMDRECRYSPVSLNRENALIQARCELGSIKRVLDALKKMGIYERTMIFVIGDHGLGSFGIGLRADLYPLPPGRGSENPDLARIMGSAMPLFLAKPFGAAEGDPFRQSLAPVSLGDIPKTILEALAVSEEAPGEPIFSLPENSPRIRSFSEGVARLDPRGQHVFPREYLIQGLGWLESSWRLVTGGRRSGPATGAAGARTGPRS